MNSIQEIRTKMKDVGDWSAYATNILITEQNGLITLRGPVRSEAERVRISRIAGEVLGASQYRNELVVAPDAAE